MDVLQGNILNFIFLFILIHILGNSENLVRLPWIFLGYYKMHLITLAVKRRLQRDTPCAASPPDHHSLSSVSQQEDMQHKISPNMKFSE